MLDRASHASTHLIGRAGPAGTRSWRHALVAGLLLAIVFVVAARAFTLRNAFSYRFHPDEHTKARQIQTGEYNFYHPQLLLRGAQVMLLARTGTIDGRINDEPRDKLEVPLYNRILHSARTMSGLFAAGAVAMLALVAWRQRSAGEASPPKSTGLEGGHADRDTVGSAAQAHSPELSSGNAWEWRGLWALALVAGSVMACPSLFANARFAKEDAALVFGTACWIAAGAWFVRRATLPRALAFAAACGLVVSAKWIGGVLTATGLVIIAIAVIRRARRMPPAAENESSCFAEGARTGRAAVLWPVAAVAAMLLVVLLVNAPILWQFGRFVEGIRYEAAHVAGDHQGLIANAPAYYLRQLRFEMGWGLALLALFEIGATAAIARRRRRAELWIAPLAALVLFLTICSTKVVFTRYLLPVTVLGHYLAALGAMTLGELSIESFTARRRVAPLRPVVRGAFAGAAALLVLGALLAPHVQRELGMLRHFGADNRDALQAWVIDPTRPPPGARVLEVIGRDAKLIQEHQVALERWAIPFTLHSVRSVAYRLPDEHGIDGSSQPGVRTPEELAAAGYTHIAIAEDRYKRFFDDRLRPTPKFEREYRQVRAVYERLLTQEGVTLVYEYNPPPHRPEWMNPAIRIYRLPTVQRESIDDRAGEQGTHEEAGDADRLTL